MDLELIDALVTKGERIIDHIALRGGGAWTQHVRNSLVRIKIMGDGHVRVFSDSVDSDIAYVDFKNFIIKDFETIKVYQPKLIERNVLKINRHYFENRTVDPIVHTHTVTQRLDRHHILLPGHHMIREAKKRLRNTNADYQKLFEKTNETYLFHWNAYDNETQLEYKLTCNPGRRIYVTDRKDISTYTQKVIYHCLLDMEIEVHSKGGFTYNFSSMEDMRSSLQGSGNVEKYNQAPLVETKIDIVTQELKLTLDLDSKHINCEYGNISAKDNSIKGPKR